MPSLWDVLRNMAVSNKTERIPLQVPFLTNDECQAVGAAILAGQITGNGPVCKDVERELAELTGAKHVLLTTSCTHALELSALCLDFGPDDEVIMPSFTFTSTANAFLLRGARIVFADISPVTFNLDPEDVRKRITSRTKAIVLVHYAGMACDMEKFVALARENKIALIEDAAQGVDAGWHGQHLGTIGEIGCFSFHSTKNITCGEGGAFLTNDDRIADRANIIREKGTNRHAFLRGEVDRYSWVSPGSSYVLSDLLAAILQGQLKNRAYIKSARRQIWHRYREALIPMQGRYGITLPIIPEGADPNYHLFSFLVGNQQRRDQVLAALQRNGVGAAFHYVPLHSAPFFEGRGGTRSEELPGTATVSSGLIRLPLFPGLSEESVGRVISELHRALDQV
jgi:dTDP-4-amino-4,6-dideoxygalactose transaminase